MSVWDNVAFGLRYQKASRDDTKRRVGEALDLVRMTDYAKRRPTQLSGGQQQRVALAGALVLRPSVLLLDEPLGALDAKLRKVLQLELRAVQREVEITFVYVTHDQEEALTMSDQIAVMADGRVEQVGPPQEIYSAPATTYVAGFLGAANIFDAEVVEVEGGAGGSAVCSAMSTRVRAASNESAVGSAAIVIRPERIALQAPDEPVDVGRNVIPGTVAEVVYLGSSTRGARRRRRAHPLGGRGGQPRRTPVDRLRPRQPGALRVHRRRGASTHPQRHRGGRRSGAGARERFKPVLTRQRRRAVAFLLAAWPFRAFRAASDFLAGGRLSSRSANPIAIW